MQISGNEVNVKVGVTKKIRDVNIGNRTIRLNDNETPDNFYANRSDSTQNGGRREDRTEENVGEVEATEIK